MSLGPIMVDLAGTSLSPEDLDLLRHPSVGGVILFSRNYQSLAQLSELTQAIHGVRTPRLLIGVDQEGGRVQRFREGFTRLPPAGRFGVLYAQSPARARLACRSVAWLMAAELLVAGVDFSFAPVLDLDRGISRVIGDRSLGGAADCVSDLGNAWVEGVRGAGMAAVGKHFPGHGGVEADSHTDLPVDQRTLAALLAEDLVPFVRLIAQGLEAVMPAHVIYPQIAPEPAGFSAFWLQEVLRRRLGFQGLIFSDDLNMAAAGAGGDYVERANAAARAGCDSLLICNNRPAAIEIVDGTRRLADPTSQLRLLRMHGRPHVEAARLREDQRWKEGIRQVASLEDLDTRSLALDDPTDPETRT